MLANGDGIRSHQWLFIGFLMINLLAIQINGLGSSPSRKLDENSTDPSIKCGGCPCGSTTCYSSPPSPVVESPPPPPPASPPPPACPPPPKKPPATKYCPPPPSAGYIYITGPPGNLYPIDQGYSGTAGREFGPGYLAVLLGLIMLFW